MQAKQPLRARQEGTDRFMPRRKPISIQQGKMAGSFDYSTRINYQSALCQALWGQTREAIVSQPILYDFTYTAQLTTASSYVLTATQIHNLDDDAFLVADYYCHPLCWGSRPFMGVNHADESNQSQPINTALACNDSNLVSCKDNGLMEIVDINTMKVARNLHSSLPDNVYYTCAINHGDVFFMSSIGTQELHKFDLREQQPTLLYTIGSIGNTIVSTAFNPNNNTFALNTTMGTHIYDWRMQNNRLLYKGHSSLGKAVSFAPDNTHIVTGGGSKDGTLQVWNINTGETLAKKSIGYQLVSAHWIDNNNIFTTEGYLSSRVACWSLGNDSLQLNDASTETHSDRLMFCAQNPKAPTKFITASPTSIGFWSTSKKKPVTKKKDDEFKHSVIR